MPNEHLAVENVTKGFESRLLNLGLSLKYQEITEKDVYIKP